MGLHQKEAIIHHQVELIEKLQPTAVLFLSYLERNEIISYDERQLIERSCLTSTDQLLRLLGSLQHNEKGWSALITYLRGDNKNLFADVLEKTANEQLNSDVSGTNPEKIPKQSALDVFSVQLTNYYQLNYAHLQTIGDSPKHVKDVWVPLQIDGRSEDYLPSNRIDHVELLDRLKSNQSRNVALIKGDPGMGKTTLAKKIAYDWAKSSTTDRQFTVVLAVPLRYAGKSDRFDQLAIDYFFSILEMQDIDKAELKMDINRLKSQLLVILDGLDEYSSYSESPFKLMFEAPFQHSSVNSREQPQTISFKLIITSRPYACERVNDDFWPLRFVIRPLDTDHLCHFVTLYCQTPEGVEKVTEYLNVNVKWVIKVPLILTFVCYLADSIQEIPTNMTSLYKHLIRQMIRRETRREKLTESVSIQKWKVSKLVKTTGELAFRETNNGRRGNYEFSSDSLDKTHVTNDSFICGFLLHKFNFLEDLLKAEFPHRSVQEFFAALHCYQLLLAGCKDELGDIRNLIVRRDSQFGRFLFGICSLEEQCVQMTNWISPSLGHSVNSWSFADEINHFGANLLDCSPKENILMGQRLLESIKHLEERITSRMHMRLYIRGYILQFHSLSDEFKEALHLVDLTRDSSGKTVDWCVADNRQSQLAVVFSRLPELLEMKFDRIDIFIWTPRSIDRTSGMEWKTYFSQIRSLPPVRTFQMSTRPYQSEFTSVSVRIGYGLISGFDLTNFGFQYGNEQRKELIDAVQDGKLVKMTENNREKIIDLRSKSTVDINVTVDRCKSQSALIYSLIRLSLLSLVQSSDHWCVCA